MVHVVSGVSRFSGATRAAVVHGQQVGWVVHTLSYRTRSRTSMMAPLSCCSHLTAGVDTSLPSPGNSGSSICTARASAATVSTACCRTCHDGWFRAAARKHSVSMRRTEAASRPMERVSAQRCSGRKTSGKARSELPAGNRDQERSRRSRENLVDLPGMICRSKIRF